MEDWIEAFILFAALLLMLLISLFAVMLSASVDGIPEQNYLQEQTIIAKRNIRQAEYTKNAEAYARRNYLRDWEEYR